MRNTLYIYIREITLIKNLEKDENHFEKWKCGILAK